MGSEWYEIPFDANSPRAKALRKLHKIESSHKLHPKLILVMSKKINKYFPTYYLYDYADEKMKVIFKDYN